MVLWKIRIKHENLYIATPILGNGLKVNAAKSKVIVGLSGEKIIIQIINSLSLVVDCFKYQRCDGMGMRTGGINLWRSYFKVKGLLEDQ